MKELNALYFPDTLPRREDISALLAVCDTISFYALPAAGNAPSPCPAPPEHGRCAGYCPVAMAADELLRFQHLVKEIQGREEEFYHGLLSSFSPGNRPRDEDSTWSLRAALRVGEKEKSAGAAEQEVVWRSMLVLQLAEMLARKEQEIARGLTAIAGQEAELLAAIRGDDKDDDEDPGLGLALPGADDGLSRPAARPEQLARAWGNLYLRDAKAGLARHLLVATGEEMLDLLADAHESLGGRAPEKLAVVSLPSGTDMTPPLAAGEEKRVSAGGRPEKRFRELLEEIAASPSLPAGLRRELEEKALEMSRSVLPDRKNSPLVRTLTLYAFEGQSCLRLFARLCNRQSPDAGAGDRSGPATGILAVLK